MKRSDAVKTVRTFIKSMEILIRRYRAAKALGISKIRYETERGMDCLLCYPMALKRIGMPNMR